MIVDCQTRLAGLLVSTIHRGDLPALDRLLRETAGLAAARLRDGSSSFSLLHVATDWPGHFPNCREVITTLVMAGAEVNARYAGPHQETPLHWAASSDDIDALDTLLDLGADINATGAVIAGGTPLEDARAFAQWRAAHRLLQRGASTTLTDEATLGLLDRLTERFNGAEPPAPQDVNRAFWGACHGGQLATAAFLYQRGADLDWVPPWENLTPLDAALRSHRDNGVDAQPLIDWLRERGAHAGA